MASGCRGFVIVISCFVLHSLLRRHGQTEKKSIQRCFTILVLSSYGFTWLVPPCTALFPMPWEDFAPENGTPVNALHEARDSIKCPPLPRQCKPNSGMNSRYHARDSSSSKASHRAHCFKPSRHFKEKCQGTLCKFLPYPMTTL